MIKLNNYQTPLDEKLQAAIPKQIWSQLLDYIETVPFIQHLIAHEEVRGYAKDRPKDKSGKIVIDITNPHILEDLDFFRERALFFNKNGTYTHIPKNPNPKSEYANFWREELRRWKHGLVRESDGEWIPGSLYFYWNYSRIWLVEKSKDEKGNISEKKGERKKDFPKPYLGDYLFYHYIEQAKAEGKHGKMLKSRGIGAEQPHSEIVKTFNGDKLVGDVKVGDKLIDIDGQETTVLEVFPQGKKDVYEVELMDGRKIKCGLDHLWYVKDFTKKDRKNARPVKLSEMIEKGLYWDINNGNNKMYKYKIPKQLPINYPEQKLPINPYVLGLLIGDGTLTTKNIKIATEDKFIVEEIERLLPDYTLNKDKSNCNYIFLDNNRFNITPDELKKYNNSKYGLNRLKREIEFLGLNVKCFDKFIPEIYKVGSIEQRVSLLQGLMDSDGSVTTFGNKEFSNSNLNLIKDVADLVRSLGMKCRLSKGRPLRKVQFQNRGEDTCQQEYRLHIITNEKIFRLPRKVKRCKQRKIFEDSAIVKIIKLDHQEESSCFLVDNKTHTYLTTDYTVTHNSFKFASMSPCNMYTLPGSGNPNFHLASDSSFLKGDKGIWGKILDNLDWISENTPLPKMRLYDRRSDMEIQLGVQDEYGSRKGLLTSVYGISLKDNPDKARGIRGPLIHYEEDGLFPNLEKAWGVNREATEEDGIAYGFMCAAGTGGVTGSSFEGSEKLFYKPNAYNIYGIRNVFDKNANGNSECGFFWGAYLNKGSNTTFENGECDVIRAIVSILMERKRIADSSNDPAALTQKKAELPITPQESIMRTDGTLFPIGDLKDYLSNISPNLQSFVAEHYVGELSINEGNLIKFKPNADLHAIREFPASDTFSKEGAIEIFELPKGDQESIPRFRYIAGADPVDDDHSTTNSLASIFIFDILTDRIVAEYTGRPTLANEYYEKCYRLLKFYNAVLLYENDKKGLFTYFSNRHLLHYLADTPQILKDMEMVKGPSYGNKAKGFNSGKVINAYGRRLQADWMLSPAYGEEETGLLNLHKIRSVGYIKEAIGWNIDGNFDRVSAMIGVMLLREEYYKHKLQMNEEDYRNPKPSLANDPFFEVNYQPDNSKFLATEEGKAILNSMKYKLNLNEI